MHTGTQPRNLKPPSSETLNNTRTGPNPRMLTDSLTSLLSCHYRGLSAIRLQISIEARSFYWRLGPWGRLASPAARGEDSWVVLRLSALCFGRTVADRLHAVSRLQAKPMGTMASLLKQLGKSLETNRCSCAVVAQSLPWQNLVGRYSRPLQHQRAPRDRSSCRNW